MFQRSLHAKILRKYTSSFSSSYFIEIWKPKASEWFHQWSLNLLVTVQTSASLGSQPSPIDTILIYHAAYIDSLHEFSWSSISPTTFLRLRPGTGQVCELGNSNRSWGLQKHPSGALRKLFGWMRANQKWQNQHTEDIYKPTSPSCLGISGKLGTV